MCFERAGLAHSPHSGFLLLHSEKAGKYIGFRQMKEYNLGLKTGMGSISYLNQLASMTP